MEAVVTSSAIHSANVEELDSELLTLLKSNLSSDEQIMFVDNFAMYLRYDMKTDFVIDLDNVFNWLGFSQKRAAKAALIRFLDEGTHYRILHQSMQNSIMNSSSRSVGRPAEQILLTPNGFKHFCISAGTEKAQKVREYYIHMEEVMFQYMRKSLFAARDELKATRNRLDTLLNTTDPECDGHLYSFHVDLRREEAHRKIGVTECLKLRRRNHGQTNPRGGYDITRPVPLGFTVKRAERILEDYLKYNGYHIHGENYQISGADIRHWIIILTGLAHAAHKSSEIRSRALAGVASIIDRLIFDAQASSATDVLQVCAYTQTDEQFFQTEEGNISHDEAGVSGVRDNSGMNSDYRFDEFVLEKCVQNSEFSVPTVAIAGAYRIWAQSASKDAYHAFLDYLSTLYKPTRIPCNDANHVVNGYKGIKLIEKPTKELPAVPSEVECFLHESCDFVPDGKVLLSQLNNEFKKWLERVRPEQPHSKDDLIRLRTELDKCSDVLESNIWTSHGNGLGYYGLHLRCNNSVIQRKSSSTSKAVVKKLVNSGQILNKWNTIAKAAECEDIAPAKLSRMIKGGTIIEGYIYCAHQE